MVLYWRSIKYNNNCTIYSWINIFDNFSENENEVHNQYDSPDYENGNNYNKYFKEKITELGKKTFLPGLAIISIGYVGQNIKLGQKKTLLKNQITHILQFQNHSIRTNLKKT